LAESIVKLSPEQIILSTGQIIVILILIPILKIFAAVSRWTVGNPGGSATPAETAIE
jgi:hypothetical protein